MSSEALVLQYVVNCCRLHLKWLLKRESQLVLQIETHGQKSSISTRRVLPRSWLLPSSWTASVNARRHVTRSELATTCSYSDMPNTHHRRRLDATVESRRVDVGGVNTNSQLAHDDCRRIRSTIWKPNIAVWRREFWSILTTFSTMTSMSSLVTNLNSLTVIGVTAQEIVNWVTTANFAVGKFLQTRRNCLQLVANCVHTAVCIGQ